MLSVGMGAAASDVPPAAGRGSYCPDAGIARVMLEELSVTLDQVMKAGAAVATDDLRTAELALSRAGTALALSTSRGSAARTALLLDAVIASKASEDYLHMLGWFPAVHTALLGLPEDHRVRQAETEVSIAEEILRGDRRGKPLDHLRTARDWLSCDKLVIPLRQADTALVNLQQTLSRGKRPAPEDLAAVTSALGRVLDVALELSQVDSAP
jgi:hypothetical protein